MRTTLTTLPDAVKRFGVRDAIAGWWFELPWRRRPLRKLRTLLFEPGKGWLRWGFGTYEVQEIIDPYLGGPWITCTSAPPLRRFWLWASGPVTWVLRGGGWVRYPDDGSWGRLTFREWRSTWADLAWLIDPEWPEGYL